MAGSAGPGAAVAAEAAGAAGRLAPSLGAAVAALGGAQRGAGAGIAAAAASAGALPEPDLAVDGPLLLWFRGLWRTPQKFCGTQPSSTISKPSGAGVGGRSSSSKLSMFMPLLPRRLRGSGSGESSGESSPARTRLLVLAVEAIP